MYLLAAARHLFHAATLALFSSSYIYIITTKFFCHLGYRVSLYACVCVRARAGDASASRNARVPPKLKWLPSAKMAARTPQSDSTGEK